MGEEKLSQESRYTMLVFFSFVLPGLLALLAFYKTGFRAQGIEGLLCCLCMLLLLSAAYSGSGMGLLLLPLVTALMGAVCAGAMCTVASAMLSGADEKLFLLPVLLIAVPLQQLMSVKGMVCAKRIRQAARDLGESFRTQNIMMLAAWGASACLAAYIVFR